VCGAGSEAVPPRRLVHTYRMLFTDAQKAEGFTRVTWEIEPSQSGFTITTLQSIRHARRRQ